MILLVSMHPCSSDEAKRKWVHHRVKLICKVLKKAKVFEVRKIQRRIAQAKDSTQPKAGEHLSRVGGVCTRQRTQRDELRTCIADAASAACAGKWSAAGAKDARKLEEQLAACKAMDLDRVARYAALRCGLAVPAEAEAAASAEEGTSPAGPSGGGGGQEHEAVLRARLLRSAPVRKELQEAVAEFNRKFNAGEIFSGDVLLLLLLLISACFCSCAEGMRERA